MRKRKEREEQEMERIRLKVRRKEAISSYQALLVETIKDPKVCHLNQAIKCWVSALLPVHFLFRGTALADGLILLKVLHDCCIFLDVLITVT